MMIFPQTKIELLEEEIKSLKNENSNLKGAIKNLLRVIENLSRFEKDIVKSLLPINMNANYKSDDNKNKIH